MRVLLIGASGVFGSRLARLLCVESGIELVLAGRTHATLTELQSQLPGKTAIITLERNSITALTLKELRCNAVIDAAGPFTAGHTQLIEAAIEAGVHYLDLAENRQFVREVTRFDEQARAKNVAVISGVSSIPALSHAAIDALTAGWRSYTDIRVGIFPGNRAPRGLSVVQSILSYVGKPVRVFMLGAWQSVPGWGLTHRVDIPFVGKRWASVCETADQDLLAERYRPSVSAQFFAGLELPVLHLGLWLLSLPVRRGWCASLLPYAKAMLWVAQRLLAFGSDRGGMTIQIRGADAAGESRQIDWTLGADTNRGPYVPTLAALILVKQLRDRRLTFRGAGPCVGMIPFGDFETEFARFGMRTNIESKRFAEPIFARALGQNFAALPLTTQRLHQPAPAAIWRGEADVTGPANIFGKIIARVFSFPASGLRQPVQVVLDVDADGTEHWARVYPDCMMRSVMSNPDPATSSVEERFGLITVRLKLSATSEGIAMSPMSWRLARIPLPALLLPKIVATERAHGAQHLFDVAVSLPLVGKLVHYRGWLRQG